MEAMTMPRLDIERQMIVAHAIAAVLAVNRPVPLLATTQARAETVVALGVSLELFSNVTARKVDTATDTIIFALESELEARERMLSVTVLPLTQAQQDSQGSVRTIKDRLLPNGTAFLRKPMDLQWAELVKMPGVIQDPEVSAAIDAEGLRPYIDLLLAYIAIYGRVVGSEGTGAGAGAEETQDAWTAAMQKLVAQVIIDYENDPAIRKELLGPYEGQVEQQRAVARAARAKNAQSAPAIGQAPAPAPAPAPEPPPTQADGSTPAAAA